MAVRKNDVFTRLDKLGKVGRLVELEREIDAKLGSDEWIMANAKYSVNGCLRSFEMFINGDIDESIRNLLITRYTEAGWTRVAVKQSDNRNDPISIITLIGEANGDHA